MEIEKFSKYSKGTIFRLLWEAYSENTEFCQRFEPDWRSFDHFIFDNLKFMDRHGFVTVVEGSPIGFMSWDPRKLPNSVEIGHNCIITEFKGRGKGKEQLSIGMEMISQLQPKMIIVKTGNIPFFAPAMKMYEGAGFIQRRIIAREGDDMVPEMIEYVKYLSVTA